jgi:SAM-dependent methyltransferase
VGRLRAPVLQSSAVPEPVVLICGPSDVGKSYLTEVVLGLEYNVSTTKTDAIYRRALKAAGIDSTRVRRWADKLRTGDMDADVAARFWAAWEAEVRAHLADAAELDVAPVFEGYSLCLPDEAARVRALVEELQPGAPVHRVLVRPSLEDWNAMHRRRVHLRRPGREVIDRDEAFYRSELADLEPVEGVEDHVVADPGTLRKLVRRKLGLSSFKWYQSLTAGNIRLKGPSDAREKAAAFEQRHVEGRSVLDVCCATALVSMLIKDRGAAKVAGVEWKAHAYAKGRQLSFALQRQVGLDTKIRLHHGDAREIVPALGRFDTVFMLGALHYFEDFEDMLALLGQAADEAVYVEFLLPEGSGVWDGRPGVQGYTRRSGTTVYAADSSTLIEVAGRALPGFELHRRRPTAGVGKGVDSYREIWTFVRSAPA